MKAIFRTEEVISFLELNQCPITAESIKEMSMGSDFIDSKIVKKELIDDLWNILTTSVSEYSYVN